MRKGPTQAGGQEEHPFFPDIAGEDEYAHAPQKRRRGSFYWRFTLSFASLLILFSVIGGAYFGAIVLPQLEDDLMHPAMLNTPSIRVLDRNGHELGARGGRYAAIVPLQDLPPYLIDAVLQIEDKRFYSHWGVDVIAIGRALYTNVMAGRVLQGGSTITQQLAKNLYLTNERTLKRKLKELLFTFWLESHFTKDEILTLYINRMYMGAGNYGMQAASEFYFNKDIRAVSLSEAALLAGLTKAPSEYAPTSSLKRAHARAREVLTAMAKSNHYDSRIIRQSMANPARAREQIPLPESQYFTDWVAGEAKRLIPDFNGAIFVTTTLDPELQKLAEQAIHTTIEEQGEKYSVTQGAMVTMEQDGAVRAMVGGARYLSSQFNRATQAKRQPGSAFKPFVYVAALEKGLRRENYISDAPITIGDWSPKNANKKYRGQVSIGDALKFSINTATVRLTQKLGRGRVARTARKFGFSTPIPAHASIGLGTAEVTLLDLTRAYIPFQAEGFLPKAHGITEITDSEGRILYSHNDAPKRVIKRSTARRMTYMLYQVVASGTGQRAAIGGRAAAGKTGTTQSHRDVWFVGYTQDYVTGVWYGNDDEAPMTKAYGGNIAASSWAHFMKGAYKGKRLTALTGAWKSRAAIRDKSKAQQFYARLSDLFHTTRPLRPERPSVGLVRRGGSSYSRP